MDARIAWAAAEMERQLATPLPLAELAASVNLSPSRFAHLFRAHTGQTPHRYLHALRMERAHALITRTFLTVKEVMVLVGCSDPSHFTRDFKRFYGVTPTDLRRAAEHGPLRRPKFDQEGMESGHAGSNAALRDPSDRRRNARSSGARARARTSATVVVQPDPPTDEGIGSQTPSRTHRSRRAARKRPK